jgi:hypothetical protein
MLRRVCEGGLGADAVGVVAGHDEQFDGSVRRFRYRGGDTGRSSAGCGLGVDRVVLVVQVRMRRSGRLTSIIR